MKPYGELQLVDGSPAQTFTELFEVAEAKQFLRMPAGITAEDDLVGAFITMARVKAEIAQGCDLVRKQYDLFLDYFEAPAIELRYPLASVDLVQYEDSNGDITTMVEGEDYVVDLKRGLITPPWGSIWPIFTPRPSSAIQIRFTSGYSRSHPFWSNNGSMVLLGMKMLITEWNEKRLPFETAASIAEYPDGIRNLLGYGVKAIIA